MKLVQLSLLSSAFATFVSGLSFYELTTGLTSDEESRIYGGSNASINKHMYMTGLHANGSDSDVFCGGTLIAPQLILTAGHCLEWDMFDVYISLGSKYRWGGGSQHSEMIRAIEAYRHPLYRLLRSTKGITHDVALLKLERPSKLQPAHLPAVDGSDNKPGVIASALGWGLVNNETSSDILQTVDVEIITNKKCAKLYSDAAENSTVDDSVICAGLGGGKDSCNGDSGGPLLVHDVVVGITSSGPDECGVLPATYARVSNALSFIHDIKAGGSTKNVTERLTAETFTLFDTSQSQEESR